MLLIGEPRVLEGQEAHRLPQPLKELIPFLLSSLHRQIAKERLDQGHMRVILGSHVGHMWVTCKSLVATPL